MLEATTIGLPSAVAVERPRSSPGSGFLWTAAVLLVICAITFEPHLQKLCDLNITEGFSLKHLLRISLAASAILCVIGHFCRSRTSNDRAEAAQVSSSQEGPVPILDDEREERRNAVETQVAKVLPAHDRIEPPSHDTITVQMQWSSITYYRKHLDENDKEGVEGDAGLTYRFKRAELLTAFLSRVAYEKDALDHRNLASLPELNGAELRYLYNVIVAPASLGFERHHYGANAKMLAQLALDKFTIDEQEAIKKLAALGPDDYIVTSNNQIIE